MYQIRARPWDWRLFWVSHLVADRRISSTICSSPQTNCWNSLINTGGWKRTIVCLFIFFLISCVQLKSMINCATFSFFTVKLPATLICFRGGLILCNCFKHWNIMYKVALPRGTKTLMGNLLRKDPNRKSCSQPKWTFFFSFLSFFLPVFRSQLLICLLVLSLLCPSVTHRQAEHATGPLSALPVRQQILWWGKRPPLSHPQEDIPLNALLPTILLLPTTHPTHPTHLSPSLSSLLICQKSDCMKF